MNLPNILTLIRIVLVAPFIICFHYHYMMLALIIFCIAALTDFFDGYLARKYNQVTNFGKIMDPLADKVLVVAAFLLFTSIGYVAPWIVIVLLIREFCITFVRIHAANKGCVIAAGSSGKLKTVIQMITIIMLFLLTTTVYTTIFIWLTVILTIYSGAEYILKNKEFLFKEV